MWEPPKIRGFLLVPCQRTTRHWEPTGVIRGSQNCSFALASLQTSWPKVLNGRFAKGPPIFTCTHLGETKRKGLRNPQTKTHPFGETGSQMELMLIKLVVDCENVLFRSFGARRLLRVLYWEATTVVGKIGVQLDMGMGQNVTTRKIALGGPCFHLPGFHLGYLLLTHSHMGVSQNDVPPFSCRETIR